MLAKFVRGIMYMLCNFCPLKSTSDVVHKIHTLDLTSEDCFKVLTVKPLWFICTTKLIFLFNAATSIPWNKPTGIVQFDELIAFWFDKLCWNWNKCDKESEQCYMFHAVKSRQVISQLTSKWVMLVANSYSCWVRFL